MKTDIQSQSKKQLLATRICDLPLSIAGTHIDKAVQILYQELQQQNIRFRPHVWISDEWHSPDGIGGIGVPFYLFHPRLKALEKQMMFEVEGATLKAAMQLLRHETGHAIDNGYGLRKRKNRQKIFGLSSTPYPEAYSPKPYSHEHVLHLGAWYACAHPEEDWAETFAVWLDPDSNWKNVYRGRPVLKKLRCIEDIMLDIQGKKPPNPSRRTLHRYQSMKMTLEQFYWERQQRLKVSVPIFYTLELYRLFSQKPKYSTHPGAAGFIRSQKQELRAKIARWTGQYQFVIDCILNDMIQFCEAKKLHLTMPKNKTTMNLLVLITAQAMHYLSIGKHRIIM